MTTKPDRIIERRVYTFMLDSCLYFICLFSLGYVTNSYKVLAFLMLAVYLINEFVLPATPLRGSLSKYFLGLSISGTTDHKPAIYLLLLRALIKLVYLLTIIPFLFSFSKYVNYGSITDTQVIWSSNEKNHRIRMLLYVSVVFIALFYIFREILEMVSEM